MNARNYTEAYNSLKEATQLSPTTGNVLERKWISIISLQKKLYQPVTKKLSYKQVLGFIGHSEAVTCLNVAQSHIVSGSDDCLVKIWSFYGEEVACLKGHTSGITCLASSDVHIASGSEDTTIKLWNIREKSCLRTLYGHDQTVTCLQFSSDTLLSGSRDGSLRIWNFDGACIQVMNQKMWIRSLVLQDSFIWIAADNLVAKWDLSGKKQCEFIAHENVIEGLCFLNDSLVTVSRDKKIKIWSGEKLERELLGHNDWIRTVCSQSRTLLSYEDQTLFVWDFDSGRNVKTVNTETCIKSLACNSQSVIIGDIDGRIKIFN